MQSVQPRKVMNAAQPSDACPGYARNMNANQSSRPAVSDGKYIITLPNFTRHDQAQFPHARRALSRRRPLGLRLFLPCPVVILLAKLLLPPQPLLLKAFNDVDRAADMRIFRSRTALRLAGLEMREQARCPPGERLGVRHARLECQGLESNSFVLV